MVFYQLLSPTSLSLRASEFEDADVGIRKENLRLFGEEEDSGRRDTLTVEEASSTHQSFGIRCAEGLGPAIDSFPIQVVLRNVGDCRAVEDTLSLVVRQFLTLSKSETSGFVADSEVHLVALIVVNDSRRFHLNNQEMIEFTAVVHALDFSGMSTD